MKATAIILVLFWCCGALAQTAGSAQAPAANPADVKSIESVVAAVYDTLSGPAGQKRDWNRFRSLFAPGARLMPIAARDQGGFAARVLSVEDYVIRTEPLLEKEGGFFETEAARRVEQWGHLAHVFSTYESRHAKGEKPYMRGINSFQLLHDGQRWWVVSILWEQERPDQRLPDQYLKP